MAERYPIKLVRDEIQNVPNVVGSEVKVWAVGQTTHVELLKAKLLEEVGEYLLAPSVEELADIMEVVEALGRVHHGRTWSQLRSRQHTKRKERGGFLGGSVMYAECAQPKDHTPPYQGVAGEEETK
jgi:predicted house-cleaning noncanonical NTP pyrophosphatase (MazG superfamily)